MIRFLTLDDFENCMSIAVLKERTAGTSSPSEENLRESYEKYFHNTGNYRSIGYFENDSIISFMLVSIFENNTRGRFWTISGLYTKEFKNHFSFKMAGFGEMLKFAFSYMESIGWYEYYYCTSERVMNAYERQWKRNNIMPNGRYELILLDKIPPNTQPQSEMYWKLMGSKLKPDTTVFKKRVLKSEFRKI